MSCHYLHTAKDDLLVMRFERGKMRQHLVQYFQDKEIHFFSSHSSAFAILAELFPWT